MLSEPTLPRRNIFTAALYWPDVEDPRYEDAQRIVTLLGPDGRPPTVIRLPAVVAGEPVFDVFTLDDRPCDPRDEVYYGHAGTVPRDPPAKR